MTKINMLTNHGSITLELDEEKAPETTANFVKYANDGFYDGTVFHRVINNFMIQGGGFTQDYTEKNNNPAVQNEAKNGLKNTRGSIAMARTNDPHSATSQFFINVADNNFLDYPGQDGWGYAVFGNVTEGMDTVDKIKDVSTGSHPRLVSDVPLSPVIIEKIEVLS
jgi:cyclophilin family peptidyl-prolyl cis-trans isomerase